MRLIDADKVKIESRKHCINCTLNGTKQCKTCVINLICDRLDLQPTIQEVPHKDLISRKWLIDAIEGRRTYLSYEDARDVIELIKKAPTVCVSEQELSEDAWVSCNAEIFERVFGMYATELWTMSEADFLKWLNQEIPEFEKKGGAE